MRILILLMTILLSSCASNSKIEEVERKILDGQKTAAQLDQKIRNLEQDKQQLQDQLRFIDGDNASKAVGIREKIVLIDQSIGSYKTEMEQINAYLKNNSAEISSVKNQQTKQRTALAEAIKKNQQLKEQAKAEIRALEEEYDLKRNTEENPDSPKQED